VSGCQVEFEGGGLFIFTDDTNVEAELLIYMCSCFRRFMERYIPLGKKRNLSVTGCHMLWAQKCLVSPEIDIFCQIM
jgi:hypothetical protein